VGKGKASHPPVSERQSNLVKEKEKKGRGKKKMPMPKYGKGGFQACLESGGRISSQGEKGS